MEKDLLKRLQSLDTFVQIPKPELEWLVGNGQLEIYQPGFIAPKGSKIDFLWIILEGGIAVRIDRGAGPKVANAEIHKGSVTGMLPYSRLKESPGDIYAEGRTEILSIPVSCFKEMINKCPLFTAHTVHTMIDRTRIHNTSALQDEKMISIGKLASGLAHELNNPASASIRNVRHLREIQATADFTLPMLNKAGLSEKQFEEIDKLRSSCIEMSLKTSLSPIEKSDLRDKLTDWLLQRKMETILAGSLADLAVTIDDLEYLQNVIKQDTLETALKWIVASCSIETITAEIEQATTQIFNLVEAIKKFSYMDNLAEKELIDVESGICDSLRVLDSKTKSKNAKINIEMDKDLPRVLANGAELNQVWFSLIDNALDAIPQSGKINILASFESNLITVKIIDNGPGIPADQLDRIFDPFFTTKPPGQGTGLGLDLSQRLIRRYGGEIYVHSKAGKTEFCVNLNAAGSA